MLQKKLFYLITVIFLWLLVSVSLLSPQRETGNVLERKKERKMPRNAFR